MTINKMYKNTHSIMFHHFHDEKHPKGQGSISKETLNKLLDWIEENYTILPPYEYIFKLENKGHFLIRKFVYHLMMFIMPI